MTPEQHALVRELNGESCRPEVCGRHKGSGKTFCYRCYNRLPKELQRNLYNRLGNGYEEAVRAAKRFLGESPTKVMHA